MLENMETIEPGFFKTAEELNKTKANLVEAFEALKNNPAFAAETTELEKIIKNIDTRISQQTN